MSNRVRVVMIAALEREVKDLVQRVGRKGVLGNRFRCYFLQDVCIVAAGIGGRAAGSATDVVIDELKPESIVSVGFAGALDPELPIGSIVRPAAVLCAPSGRRFSTASGNGLLVSVDSVVGAQEKQDLKKRYGAIAVDMEAGTVAERANRHGIPFFAVKSISDSANVTLPELQRFVSDDGGFRTAAFVAFLAIHPRIWPAVRRLARDGARAATALQLQLGHALDTDEFIPFPRSNPTRDSR